MRLRSQPDTVPAGVNRLLLPHEVHVIAVRLHPTRLVPPLTTATGGLFAAVAVIPLDRGDLPVELAVWFVAGLLIAQGVRALLDWFTRYFVVTLQRVFTVDYSGIAVELPSGKIEGVRLKLSFAGRIFGFGTLIFDSARIAFDYVPYPEQVYLEILRLLHKAPDDEE